MGILSEYTTSVHFRYIQLSFMWSNSSFWFFQFFVTLLFLVLIEVALILVLSVYHKELDKKAKDDLRGGMRGYLTNEELKKSWDNMQRIFKCCGVSNHTDWHNKTSSGKPPESCCRDNIEDCHHWEEPCYEKAKDWLLANITSVLGFGVCIGIVQILALVFSMLMYCQILRAEKYMDWPYLRPTVPGAL